MAASAKHNGAILCPKPSKPGDRSKATVTLVTNLYEITFDNTRPLYRYDVHVFKIDGSAKQKEVTRGAGDDYRRVERRRLCYDLVMKKLQSQHSADFGDLFASVYDGRHIFFSYKKLPMDPNGTKTYQILVPREEKESLVGAATSKKDKAETITYKVTLAPTVPDTVDMTDFSKCVTRDLEERDRTLVQTLELMTSQVVFYQNRYANFGTNFYDSEVAGENWKEIGVGRYLADGFSKSVRIVGNEKSPYATLQIEVKKAAFFKSQPVLATLAELMRVREIPRQELNEHHRDTLSRMLQDLRVQTQYEGRRDFIVAGISDKKPNEIIFEYHDPRLNITRMTSVEQFLQTRYKLKLKYPMLPCLMERSTTQEGSKFNYYPMELCKVMPNQRVSFKKQTPDQQQKQIRECALKPSDHQQQTNRQIHENHLLNNRWLAAMGIEMAQKPVKVQGRVLPPPRIVYGKGGNTKSNVIAVKDKGDWDMRSQTWYEPGKCGKWAVICFDKSFPDTAYNGFVRYFNETARKTGIRMGNLEPIVRLDQTRIKDYFKDAMSKQVDYIVCIMSAVKDQNLKDYIKYAEYKVQIVTQCIRSNIANDIFTAPKSGKSTTTLLNILAKTNMKLGGLNHTVDLQESILSRWFDGKVMYAGFDVCHPTHKLTADERRRGIKPKEPSCIGYVGSLPNKPLFFTGDYELHDPTNENISDRMERMMTELLSRWKRVPAKLPERIVVFRDGVSEGQFRMVLEEEVPEMKKSFEKIGGPTYKPKLTVVVVIKRHDLRFFMEYLDPKKSAQEQDVPAGTVVDRDVVHPGIWEFFLKPHAALQGTCKFTRLCVLLDENEFSQNEIEGVAYTLTYGHQIVAKSVSIPAPVYGADQLAARGKRMFLFQRGPEENCPQEINWEQATESLKISNTKLANRKFWA